jgi:hypothetical protein
MEETALDRHRCHGPRCGRPFAFVFRHSFYDVPIPLAVACPHCGRWEVVLVPTGAVRETTGTYILPLGHRVAPLGG